MKRSHLLSAIIATMLVCALASPSPAGIIGSKHDFGQYQWAKNQICLPCHTPHNAIVRDANGALVDAPLWNHTLSTATYTLYVDATGNPHRSSRYQQPTLPELP